MPAQNTTSPPLMLNRISAGFPSPAADYLDRPLDLNELCIERPAATFFLRVEGDSMIDAGIFPDDILVVDRSLTARHGHIIIARLDQQFTVKELQFHPHPQLRAHNPHYPPILLNEFQDFEVFGIVTWNLHALKKGHQGLGSSA